MLRYIARRVLQGILTIIIVSFITFGLMHVGPGDPIEAFVGERPMTADQIERLRERWGLDRPWYEQYLTWAGNMARGDFGTSIMRPGQTVGEMMRSAAPETLKLNIYTFILSVAVAIPLGIIAGVRRYSKLDYGSMVGSTLGICIPNFWLALMLILIFSLQFGLLPSSGTRTWHGWIMPVIVLATAETALLARLMRSSTIEVLNQDYVTTARAKGLAEYTVIVRHAVRNALLPVVTVLGYRVAFLLSGTIVVEYIFAIPGIGRLFLSAVLRQDYQVVQAIVLLFAVLVVVANIVTDLIYAYVDPRIRLG
jgi:peptide/nickel transport system permease protein